MATWESAASASHAQSWLAPARDVWTALTPANVREQYHGLGDAAGWRRWARHLAKRKQPRPAENLPNRVLKDQADRLADWLATADMAPAAPEAAAEHLAWCRALPALASHVDEEHWWRLFNHLYRVAEDAAVESMSLAPLVWQRLAGELPLTLSHLLPELHPCTELRRLAHDTLTTGLRELVDDAGLPPVAQLPHFRALVDCWVRCSLIDNAGSHVFDVAALEQLHLVVQNAICVARPKGGCLLGPADDGSSGRGGLRRAARELELAIEAREAAIDEASLVVSQPSSLSAGLPSVYSERSKWGVLRSTWKKKSPRLAVSHGDDQVRLEFFARGEVLWSGEWCLQVRVDGESMPLVTPWEDTCWVSDEDVDYLELQAKLAGGVLAQRQLVLDRRGRFLYLADAVLGPERAVIECVSMLPLTPTTSFVPAEETREGRLVGRRPCAVVLPLALGEWRTDGRPGKLVAHEKGLELRHQVYGQRLYAPLLLSLEPKRLDCELTWRQLTVAAKREITPPDVAVGYRAQIGDRQWLVYRSLGDYAVRTVLGQNLNTEFMLGRFRRTGDVDRLIEIEGAE